MAKIPKVVTTPDLLSVFEAIEESVSSDTPEHEIESLKKFSKPYYMAAKPLASTCLLKKVDG